MSVSAGANASDATQTSTTQLHRWPRSSGAGSAGSCNRAKRRRRAPAWLRVRLRRVCRAACARSHMDRKGTGRDSDEAREREGEGHCGNVEQLYGSPQLRRKEKAFASDGAERALVQRRPAPPGHQPGREYECSADAECAPARSSAAPSLDREDTSSRHMPCTCGVVRRMQRVSEVRSPRGAEVEARSAAVLT
eukprot:6183003-Pleurochrysis_carterae.AAC.4